MKSGWKMGICMAVFLMAVSFVNSEALAVTYWAGKVANIWFSAPNNLSFRVYPDPSTPLVGCKDNLAYIDISSSNNSNYQVYVSSLMTAFASGKTVHLVLATDAQGFCNINEGSVDAS